MNAATAALVAKAVAGAPPATDEQRALIAALFLPVAQSTRPPAAPQTPPPPAGPRAPITPKPPPRPPKRSARAELAYQFQYAACTAAILAGLELLSIYATGVPR